MTDGECVAFLQWCLPRMGFRWRGFRKVRRQVCRRITRRIRELGLGGPIAYRAHLETHPPEWDVLAPLCRVTISRFFRDRGVYEALLATHLPALAEAVRGRGDTALRAWSAGCASGEEPYTLQLLWDLELGPRTGLGLGLLATDIDDAVLARAARGEYAHATLRELPQAWRERGFDRAPSGLYSLRAEHRDAVRFERLDLRADPLPEGPFDLVLCRNAAFTYFDEGNQRAFLRSLTPRVQTPGLLVMGKHETLLEDEPAFTAVDRHAGIYRRV